MNGTQSQLFAPQRTARYSHRMRPIAHTRVAEGQIPLASNHAAPSSTREVDWRDGTTDFSWAAKLNCHN